MKFDEVKDVVFGEMAFEIGTRKDGTFGYRSVVNGNMTDETPPKNKEFIDAVMKVLNNKKHLPKLGKFDLTTIDVESLTNGGAKINFEDGTSMLIKPEEITDAIKGRGTYGL